MQKASPENNYHYNGTLTVLARENRQRMTKAEACLWKYVLRARKMENYTFRRQRPILSYIVDFVCLELLLVIEVDGFTHEWEETQERDKQKEKDLRTIGFDVLRFTNYEVLSELESVRQKIRKHVLRISSNEETL